MSFLIKKRRCQNDLYLVVLFTFCSSLKTVLKDIIAKKHDIEICKYNWKQNGKIFNQVPKMCDFFTDSTNYDDLLTYKNSIYESADDISSETNGTIKSIAQFRIELVTLEDLQDEIRIGCRKREDDDDKLESSVQTL